MKKLLIILCGLTLLCSCIDDVTDDSNLTEEDKYFEDYEAPASKWGYVDTIGNLVIEKKYDDLRPFENGLAIANLEGKWGFIDKSGQVVIDHKYRAAFPFKEGLARIQNFDKKYGFIDKNGSQVIIDSMSLVFDFNSHRARAKQGENYGYINPKGEWVIQPFFAKCSNFKDGFARVYQFTKAGLIDTTGLYKIPLESGFEKIYEMSDDMIRMKKGKLYSFTSIEDFSLRSPTYSQAIDFNEGIAAVANGDSWILIDKNFQEVATLSGVSSVKYAGNNMWVYKEGTQYGLIDRDGKKRVDAIYDMIYSFSNGFAPFQSDEYWGYLDQEGKIALPANFPLAWSFEEGFARVINSGGISYINRNFKLAFEKGFYDAHDFSEGLAHVQ